MTTTLPRVDLRHSAWVRPVVRSDVVLEIAFFQTIPDVGNRLI